MRRIQLKYVITHISSLQRNKNQNSVISERAVNNGSLLYFDLRIIFPTIVFFYTSQFRSQIIMLQKKRIFKLKYP